MIEVKIEWHVMDTVDGKKQYFLAGPAFVQTVFFSCKLPSSPEWSSR